MWHPATIFPTEDEEYIDDRVQSSGSGFLISEKGLIVTNYHVVESCDNKSKIYYNNKEVDVKLVAKDKQLDLALLRADVKNKYFIKISNKPLRKLLPIIAAGYPFGKYLSDDLKFTSGIVKNHNQLHETIVGNYDLIKKGRHGMTKTAAKKMLRERGRVPNFIDEKILKIYSDLLHFRAEYNKLIKIMSLIPQFQTPWQKK